MCVLTTHDTKVAKALQENPAVRCLYFQEVIEDMHGTEPINFDYRVKNGIVGNTNALKLLRLMGLSAGTKGEDGSN